MLAIWVSTRSNKEHMLDLEIVMLHSPLDKTKIKLNMECPELRLRN